MSLGTRKLGITVFAFAVVLSFAIVASAQAPGIYFTPKVGYSRLSAASHARIGGVSQYLRSMAWDNKDSKGQAVLGLAVGYDFNSVYAAPIRIEFEYAWRDKDEIDKYADMKVGVQSFFANVYFDIHNSTSLTPYIGGGLGLARVDADLFRGYRFDDSTGRLSKVITRNAVTNFAWNIGAGVAWTINDHLSLDLGYRYADFGNVDCNLSLNRDYYTYVLDTDVTAHEVLLGLRYTF